MATFLRFDQNLRDANHILNELEEDGIVATSV